MAPSCKRRIRRNRYKAKQFFDKYVRELRTLGTAEEINNYLSLIEKYLKIAGYRR